MSLIGLEAYKWHNNKNNKKEEELKMNMEIKRTKNYEEFKFKKENREINYNKVMRLKAKLIEDGRQILPIICNRNMEIIDGQHRFEALKELNWEIMYYVDEAVTSMELISINNTQSNWSLSDYIHYYASLGDAKYIELEKIIKKYNDIPIRVIMCALTKRYYKDSKIKAGEFNITEEELEEGKECLEWLDILKNNINVRVTEPRIFYFLVVKAYYLEGISRERLYNCIIERYGTENYGSAEQCATVLEHWYNFKQRNYRYISNEILPRR